MKISTRYNTLLWTDGVVTTFTFAGFIQLLVQLGILYPSLRPLP